GRPVGAIGWRARTHSDAVAKRNATHSDNVSSHTHATVPRPATASAAIQPNTSSAGAQRCSSAKASRRSGVSGAPCLGGRAGSRGAPSAPAPARLRLIGGGQWWTLCGAGPELLLRLVV